MNVNDGHLVSQCAYEEMADDERRNYEQVPSNLLLSAKLELMGKKETHVGKEATSQIATWARSERSRLKLKAKNRKRNKLCCQ